MAQQLRVLAALPEVPSSHGSSHLSITPVPGDPTPSHRHIGRQNTKTPMHIKMERKKGTRSLVRDPGVTHDVLWGGVRYPS